MTTTVRVHVNGNYRATIVQRVEGRPDAEPVMVIGGEADRILNFAHGKTNIFVITEEWLGEQKSV